MSKIKHLSKYFFSTKLLVFSSFGKVYSLRSHDIPEASLKARGKPIVNLLPFSKEEKIATFLPLPLEEETWHESLIIFATKKGMIRKNKLIDVAKSGKRELRESGKLAIKLDPNDQLISIKLANKCATSAPPRAPNTIPYNIEDHFKAARAAHKAPAMIEPSIPIFRTPLRSVIDSPSAANAKGTASRIAAPKKTTSEKDSTIRTALP